MAFYINYYFTDIQYDANYYQGHFSCPDLIVECDFRYNRSTKECVIRNSNKPVEDILPLPVWLLDKRLEENGKLSKKESKVSY